MKRKRKNRYIGSSIFTFVLFSFFTIFAWLFIVRGMTAAALLFLFLTCCASALFGMNVFMATWESIVLKDLQDAEEFIKELEAERKESEVKETDPFEDFSSKK